MNPPLILGVDLGATWLRACLARGGRARWTARRPAVNWRELPPALTRLLRGKSLRRVETLVVGGTRLGHAKDRAELRHRLKPLAARVHVLTDFELAHRAAFDSGPGIVLLASTGSIAFARGNSGKTRRAGGMGPFFGDEGSGFWLGRRAVLDEPLRRALRLPPALSLAHRADPVRATAALAPRVLRGSQRLREEAAERLAALAREAARGLPLPAPKPLALHGSLFKNAQLRASVLRRLGRGWRLVAPRTSAHHAAAGLSKMAHPK